MRIRPLRRLPGSDVIGRSEGRRFFPGDDYESLSPRSVCVGPDFAMAERLKPVEKAAVAELKALPKALRISTLAAAVLELARRLDNDPPDREAAQLAREVRLALADLRRQAGVDSEEVIDVRASALGT
jgi:hypothetical protein